MIDSVNSINYNRVITMMTLFVSLIYLCLRTLAWAVVGFWVVSVINPTLVYHNAHQHKYTSMVIASTLIALFMLAVLLPVLYGLYSMVAEQVLGLPYAIMGCVLLFLFKFVPLPVGRFVKHS